MSQKCLHGKSTSDISVVRIPERSWSRVRQRDTDTGSTKVIDVPSSGNLLIKEADSHHAVTSASVG